MAASQAIFGGLVISCASTSLRFWVQVTHILSNFIDSEVSFDREWGGTYSTFVY